MFPIINLAGSALSIETAMSIPLKIHFLVVIVFKPCKMCSSKKPVWLLGVSADGACYDMLHNVNRQLYDKILPLIETHFNYKYLENKASNYKLSKEVTDII